MVFGINQVSEKLAHSLEQLKQLQDNGVAALQLKILERSDRAPILIIN